MKRIGLLVALLAILVVGGYIAVTQYSYVFAKHVDGQILRVERVTQPEAIIAGGRPIPPEQMFSFAMSIKDAKGDIHTASSEDRQWAVATAGQCVEAKFLAYPPWDFAKAGTYFGARVLRLYECGKK
jgi:hypothetical protein